MPSNRIPPTFLLDKKFKIRFPSKNEEDVTELLLLSGVKTYHEIPQHAKHPDQGTACEVVVGTWPQWKKK